MAKKKEDKKKKNKYSRKPSTVSGSALKGVAKIARETIESGKRFQYKGKMTKAAKDILTLKSVTDPADKAAIKAARSAKGKKELLESKASKNAIIRNTKNVGKRASKESQKKFNEKAMKAQASQDAQKMKDRNQITKSKILAERKKRKAGPEKPPVIKKYVRKGETPPALPKQKAKSPAINERRLPDTDSKNLKPITGKNIKETVTPEVKKPKGKITESKKAKRKLSKGEKIAVGATAVAGGAALLSKDKKAKKSTKAAVPIAAVKAKTGQTKTPKKAVNASPRNDFNKKVKPEVKKPQDNAPSTSEALNNVMSDPKLKDVKVAPKVRQEAVAKARKYLAKNKGSDIPWEKLLESITMLMSSHILSKGISKRYK